MEYPYFEDDGLFKVNEFFKALTEAVKTFCSDADFPRFTVYRLEHVIKEEKSGSFEICVSLRLRQRGRTVKKREVTLSVSDGMIIHLGTEELI